ncbi:MAG: hypothetical protein ACTSU2_07320 [Promethearchaeota archaeon]
MSDDNFSEEDKELYLEVLRDSTTPFDRFVARGDIEDVIDIPSSRKIIDRMIFRAIKQTQFDQSTRLIPILGEAGSGKTHTYWAYKDKERKIKREIKGQSLEDNSGIPSGWTIIYVPSPPASIRILLHVYTCIIDELGANILSKLAHKLVERWGGSKKKHLGIFGKTDIEEVIQRGIREYPGVFADCVKALVLYELDKEKRPLAERWLLGEELDEEELDILGISSVIEEDDICLAMIKLISEHTEETIVLYFDEMESPYRMHGEDAERKFLEVLKRLYNEVKNLIIIIAVLKDIWPRILEIADMPLRSRMEPEHELKKWAFDDLKLYFAKAMVYFWDQNNLPPPPNVLFPLDERVLETIYNKTNGNQRSIIKLIRIFIEKIIMGDMTIEDLIKDEKIKPHAEVPSSPLSKNEIDEEIKKIAENARASSEKSNLAQKIEQMMAEEDFIIEVNPASVAGAALKCIKILGEQFNKSVDVDVEFSFIQNKRTVTLAGLIKLDNKKIALEVPSVKSFNRAAGVAGFYAVKRLDSAFSQNQIDEAILIIPKGTSGQKFQSLLKKHPNIHLVEINDDEGEELLLKITKSKVSEKGWEIGKYIFPDLPDYQPEELEEKDDGA